MFIPKHFDANKIMVNDKKHYILCATGTNNTPAIHLQHYIIGSVFPH